MVTSFHFPVILSFNPRRNHLFYLALLWIAGLLSGSLVVIGGGNGFLSWMRAAELDRVSIISLFFSLFLPFLFSAFAVLISKPQLIYFVYFAKAFLFGFCAGGIMMAYSSAGWLVCLLLFFAQWCMSPVLFWFCSRCLRGGQTDLWRDLAVCAALCFLLGSADRCMVSPFLAMLIEI